MMEAEATVERLHAAAFDAPMIVASRIDPPPSDAERLVPANLMARLHEANQSAVNAREAFAGRLIDGFNAQSGYPNVLSHDGFVFALPHVTSSSDSVGEGSGEGSGERSDSSSNGTAVDAITCSSGPATRGIALRALHHSFDRPSAYQRRVGSDIKHVRNLSLLPGEPRPSDECRAVRWAYRWWDGCTRAPYISGASTGSGRRGS